MASAQLSVSPAGPDLPAGRPLEASALHSDQWTEAVGPIVRELSSAPMPTAAREGLTRLAGLGKEVLAALAAKILSGEVAGLDLAVRVAITSSEAPPELAGAADLVVDGPEGFLELLRRL